MIFALLLMGLTVIFSCGVGDAAAANTTSIYVNTHGNDSWNGYYANFTNGTNGPKATITDAVSTVPVNGTVYIANGNYNESIINIYNNMTIIGQSQTGTIIDAKQQGVIFDIHTGPVVTIENLTLTNGNSDYGGAIYNYGTLTIIKSTLENNTATSNGDGGAIYNQNTLAIINSTIQDSNSGYGGAICSDNNGLLTMVNSTIQYNNATYSGGALYNVGILNITNCKFYKNTVSDDGGAIYSTNSNNLNSNVTITNSNFLNNTSNNWGGVLYNYATNGNTSIIINNSTFLNNTAGGNGGAIYNGCYNGTALITIQSSTFTNNTASDGDGGAIHNNGILNVTNSTFNNNSALQNGGGAIENFGYLITATSSVTNSTFNNNSASNGGVIENQGYDGNATFNITNCILLNNTGAYGDAIHNGAYNGTATGVLNYNQIIGNNDTQICSYGKNVDARYNWWGSNNNPSSLVYGNVTVTPWLLKIVSSVNPINNAVNIPNNTTITVTFSEPIKTGNNNIQLVNSSGTAIPFTSTLSSNILTITPTNLLNNDTKYTLTLHTGSVTDLSGNPLTLWGTSFSVGPAPTIKTVNPINNASTKNVSESVKFTFSEPIKKGNMSIEFKTSNGTAIPFTTSTINTTGTTTLTITPSITLTNGTYTVVLHTGSVTDLAGNPLALYQTKFTVDTIPPTVKTVNPINNATNITLNPVINFTFSEAIKTGNMNFEFKTSNGTIIPFTTTINGTTLAIKPSAALSQGVKYTIILHTGSVTDLAGNPLALYSTSFTTTKT